MESLTASKASYNRALFADILRIVAVFAVISIHVHTRLFYERGLEGLAWWVSNILFSATKWAVPVFVMLSGAFLLNPQRESVTRKVLPKRILKLLVPLIVWTIICKLIAFFLFQSNEIGPLSSDKIIFIFKNEALSYHLWFLYMLIGLYLLSPILKAYFKAEPENIILFLILSFISNCVLMVFVFLNLERVVYNPFYYFSGFIVYFIAGYYFMHLELSRKSRLILYGLAILGCATSIIMNFILREKHIIKWDIFIDNLSPIIILISWAVFVFFKNIKWEDIISAKSQSFIQILSAYSYGIYLLHTVVLALVRRLPFLRLGDMSNIFMDIPLTILVVFIISFLLVGIIKRVKFINYIIP